MLLIRVGNEDMRRLLAMTKFICWLSFPANLRVCQTEGKMTLSPPLPSGMQISKQNMHRTFDPIDNLTPVHLETPLVRSQVGLMFLQIAAISLANSPALQVVVARGDWLSRAAVAFQILTVASLGSTSFIEEEHQGGNSIAFFSLKFFVPFYYCSSVPNSAGQKRPEKWPESI